MSKGGLWTYFERKILIDNPDYGGDYRRVQQFAKFRSRIHHKTSQDFSLRDTASFNAALALLPSDFFCYFNSVLSMIGLAPVIPSLSRREIHRWNRRVFLMDVVRRIEDALDSGSGSRLVPALVLMFHKLAWKREPRRSDLRQVTAVVVPGGRTFDRAVEALRVYLQCQGRPYLIATGNAPYWDQSSAVTITESEAHAAFWRMHGVPPERIIAEADARNTEENAQFLDVKLREIVERESLQRPQLLLVSSPFHLARFRLNAHLHLTVPCEIFAIASTVNRYLGPEYYFFNDPKAGLGRRTSLAAVFSEYLKIAFTVSAQSGH